MMNNRLACFAILLLSFGSPLLAASDADAPLDVEADRWEADQEREISVFSGNVILRKGSVLITAREARIHAIDGNVKLGTILGSPATFRQRPASPPAGAPDIEGEADRIEYDGEAEQVVLTGSAWVRQGDDHFSGESIHYDLATQKVLATADEKTPQRVRIIFTPRQENTAPDKSTGNDPDENSEPETATDPAATMPADDAQDNGETTEN
jgi:lipopolysaccharide export system protein LptA